MKNQVISILICIIISSLNNGCAAKSNKEYITIQVPAEIEYCHSDEDLLPINFEKLNKNYHIGSLKNEDIKMKNIIMLLEQNNKFLGIIQCYDSQIKASKKK